MNIYILTPNIPEVAWPCNDEAKGLGEGCVEGWLKTCSEAPANKAWMEGSFRASMIADLKLPKPGMDTATVERVVSLEA